MSGDDKPLSDREIRKHVDAWGIERLREAERETFLTRISNFVLIAFFTLATLAFLAGNIYGLIVLIRKYL